MNRPRIGVFDSGVGGLSVLGRLLETVPDADYHYLGDTARVPYGIRSQGTVEQYSREGLRYLASLGSDLLVVACNTSSAIAVPQLRMEFSVPVLGVIEDGIEAAEEVAEHGVLVLGTRATIQSGVYQHGLHRRRTDLDVRGLACPLFVPVVEEGWGRTPIATEIARTYLAQCDGFDYDCLLLACTHFPFMAEALASVVPHSVRVIDPSFRVAARIASMVPSAATNASPNVHIHVTDTPQGFVHMAEALGIHVRNHVTHVDIGDLTG